MASLPYPRRPPNSFHRTHSKFVYASPPTEFTEFTEAFGVEEPPTDFTDAHRWLGCVGFSHGIHGIHRSFWRKIFSHGFHRCPQMVRLRRVLPRNSQNSQIFLLRQKLLWVLWENSLVGSPNLCVSVQSVEEYLAQPETSVGSVGECADAKSALISLSLRSFVVYLQCKQYIRLWANTSIRLPTGASNDCSDRSSASRY